MKRIFSEVDDRRLMEAWTDDDGLGAYLTLHPFDTATEAGAQNEIVATLRRQGFELNGFEESLRTLLSKPLSGGAPLNKHLFLQGHKPGASLDGSIEWTPKESKIGDLSYPPPILAGAPVSRGEEIAKIQPPREGKAGRDVFGKALPAAAGRSVPFHAGEGAEIVLGSASPSTPGARILRAGRNGLALWIRDEGRERFEVVPYFVQSGAEDTREAAFEGVLRLDGEVKRGRRFRAERGLVATQVVSGGRLASGTWMALSADCLPGSEISAWGPVNVRALIGASLRTGGDLRVETEIRGSQVRVLGDLIAPAARVVGGEITVLGSADVLSIGNEREAPCTLALNAADLLESLEELWRERMDRLESGHQSLSGRLAALGAKGRPLSASEKEEMTILQAHQRRADQARAALFAVKRAWIARVRSKDRIELVFRDALHAGVEIRFGGRTWHNRETRRGPGRLLFDSKDGARFVPAKMAESAG